MTEKWGAADRWGWWLVGILLAAVIRAWLDVILL